MDALLWPAVATVATSGWGMFGWLARRVLRQVTNGDLITRRESDAKDKETAHLREANRDLRRQLGVLLNELAPPVVGLSQALHQAVDEAPRGGAMDALRRAQEETP